MLLLVAAATDQTGRTITMLSIGLVAVAVGLIGLTIWYWRFTSPKQRLDSRTVDPAMDAVESMEAEVEPPTMPGDGGRPIGLDDDEWAALTKAVTARYLEGHG